MKIPNCECIRNSILVETENIALSNGIIIKCQDLNPMIHDFVDRSPHLRNNFCPQCGTAYGER